MELRTVVGINGMTVIFRGGVEIKCADDGMISISHYPYDGTNRAFVNVFQKPHTLTVEVV